MVSHFWAFPMQHGKNHLMENIGIYYFQLIWKIVMLLFSILKHVVLDYIEIHQSGMNMITHNGLFFFIHSFIRYNYSIRIIPFSLFCYNEEAAELEQESASELDEKTREVLSIKEKQSKFLKSVTARLTVAQIVSSVRDSATLTFDFICYLIFASWIAAMGLLDNSVISLVASMLVSPMMVRIQFLRLI